MTADAVPERRGMICHIPLDKNGLPDDAKMRAQGDAVMREAGRRAAMEREARVLDALFGAGSSERLMAITAARTEQ